MVATATVAIEHAVDGVTDKSHDLAGFGEMRRIVGIDAFKHHAVVFPPTQTNSTRA